MVKGTRDMRDWITTGFTKPRFPDPDAFVCQKCAYNGREWQTFDEGMYDRHMEKMHGEHKTRLPEGFDVSKWVDHSYNTLSIIYNEMKTTGRKATPKEREFAIGIMSALQDDAVVDLLRETDPQGAGLGEGAWNMAKKVANS